MGATHVIKHGSHRYKSICATYTLVSNCLGHPVDDYGAIGDEVIAGGINECESLEPIAVGWRDRVDWPWDCERGSCEEKVSVEGWVGRQSGGGCDVAGLWAEYCSFSVLH